MELPVQLVNNTTYLGMNIRVLVNGDPVNLTGAAITAIFTLRGTNQTKKFTIDNGISDVVLLDGSFSLLKDTIIDWQKGIWDLTVRYQLSGGEKQAYIHNLEAIWIL